MSPSKALKPRFAVPVPLQLIGVMLIALFLIFMFIVMTVQAEQFPVGAIGRVVVMVVIFVVYGQLAPGFFPEKLATASCTDMGK